MALLSSTGTYVQYTVINHNRKEYTYKTESLCYTPETKLIQHCKSTTIQFFKYIYTFIKGQMNIKHWRDKNN